MAKENKKQLEIELDELRDEMRREFAIQCENERQLMEEIGWIDKAQYFDEAACIGRKMEEWERERTIDPKGKYQDRQRIQAEYQKHFAIFMQECCPDVFEELRELTPLYKRVFGDQIDAFHSLFNFRLTEYLRRMESSIEGQVNAFLETPLIFFGMHGPNFERYRMDFQIGETGGILKLLRLLIDRSNEEGTEAALDATEHIRSCLYFNPYKLELPDGIDSSLVPAFLVLKAEQIANHLRIDENRIYVPSDAEQRIAEILKEPNGLFEPDIGAFCELQIALFDWTRRHHLEKDWLIRYAYFIISRLSVDQEANIADIEITALNVRSLLALPFEFKFESWDAGEERRQDYEKRLRKDFDERLKMHFHDTSSYLNLHRIKTVSKPRDFERVKWLVYRNLKGWNAEQIVEKFFPREAADRTKSKRDNKTFENKKKHVESEMRELRIYELPYRKPAK